MPDTTIHRVLAFDFGTKRFGSAFGQSLTNSTTPLTEITARDGIPDWNTIENLIKEWEPTCFVTGLPLNMDGTENAMCQRARKFSNRLHGRYGLPSHLWDERLTSFEVKQDSPSENYKNHPVDSLAAASILQSWLNSQEH